MWCECDPFASAVCIPKIEYISKHIYNRAYTGRHANATYTYKWNKIFMSLFKLQWNSKCYTFTFYLTALIGS